MKELKNMLNTSNQRVIQLTPTLSVGDAVSNDVFAMSEALTEMGVENYIVAGGMSERVKQRAVLLDRFLCRPEDILIYHMSIGNPMSKYVLEAPARKKFMVYHNITPAHFFAGISGLETACRTGREELKALASVISYAFCDSDYNRKELEELGYSNTVTLPIIFHEQEYLETVPDKNFIEKYRDENCEWTNILFVGRIAPNKKQEDIIHSFALYHKYINPRSRLFLVGAVVDTERYQRALEEYILKSQVEDVIFLGHVTFQEILAAYSIAHLFLCHSEHEGFCVPLLEAMTFNVPILAYSEAAVPDTLGSSGVLFTEKDHRLVAELMNLLITNKEVREQVIAGQQRRLKDFRPEKTLSRFKELIKPLLA